MSAHETFHFHSLDELRTAIAAESLNIGVSEDVSPLLQPVEINGFRVPNRMVVLPMEGCDGLADGSPDELTFRRYRRFAAGGAGLLWFEATAVVEEGRANPRQLWIRDQTAGSFASLVEESLKAARSVLGPSHRPMLVLQLTHSGRYSRPVRAPRPIIAHHSKFLDPIHKLGPDYPLISDDELDRLQDRFVEAARAAKKAGFDAVDVKACHRYLMSELLASHTRANSRYGGADFENRSRLFRDIVRRIREEVPGIIVTSRMNCYDAMAYPYGYGVDREDESKPDLTEPKQLVKFLGKSGSDLVNVTIGNPYFNPHVNRPFDLPAVGGAMPPESPLDGVARFCGVVREIQQSSPEMTVIGGGYTWLRHFAPHVGAEHIRRGWVGMVGFGRMAFAYPNFARDLMEHGKLDPEKVCVACSACTQIMRDGGRSGCVPRDAAIYEPIYKAGRAEALDTITEMAKTCRQCNDPTCVPRCPARVDVPRFVGHIAAGRYREAYETLRQSNVLAAVCGYVCPSETLCESGCINEAYTETVPIRHLQRWVSRKAVEEGWAREPRSSTSKTGHRVAVIGGGPAGVAAAAALAASGHAVTMFDPAAAPEGGTAGATIPAERLPEPILRREIEDVLAASGNVEWRNQAIAVDFTLDRLMAEGYDAALVSVGLTASVPLPAKSRPEGVTGALEFLRAAKRGATVSGEVLVLGGGNTAIDAALTAKRCGADVSIVYRRSFAEMPAWPNERDQAISAGVNFLILTQPLEYVSDAAGKVTGVKVVRTRLSEPGADGRRTPVEIAGSDHVLPATVVIEAIGQQAAEPLRAALPGIAFTGRGLVKTNSGSFETTRTGVFAAGDIVNGGTTVVQAVAEGTCAAKEIDAWLASLGALPV